MVRRSARLAALLCAAASPLATATTVTLDFEGMAPHRHSNQIQIRDFYNGGTASNNASGPNLGVSFTTSALLLCLNTESIDCTATSKGPGGPADSGLAALYFDSTAPFINVAGGFLHELSLWYSQPIVPQTLNPDIDVGIEAWDGLNGTGKRLASVTLPHTLPQPSLCRDYGSGAYQAVYCPFVPFSLSFDGVARSVHFTGNVNRAVFDDIRLGGNPPPQAGTVPEPASAALCLLALGVLARLRRQPAAGSARSSASM